MISSMARVQKNYPRCKLRAGANFLLRNAGFNTSSIFFTEKWSVLPLVMRKPLNDTLLVCQTRKFLR